MRIFAPPKKRKLLMKRKSFALEAFVNPRILTGFMLCLAAITLGFSALVATASSPVVITVNTLLDEATSGDGLCSLREAINNFNAQTDTTGGDCASGIGPTEINFSVSGTITLGSTLPGISS